MLAWLTVTLMEERKSEDRRFARFSDLPVLATRWSGTSAILSSQVNGPVAHGSTW